MKILVTGGAGFIGANLCRRLLDTPQVLEVRVLDDLSSGAKANLEGLGVQLFEGSILDRQLVTEVAGGCAAIIHLAAVPSVPRSIAHPVASHEANATGTLHVLEAARDVGGIHVVLASSSSVYGANPTLPKTEGMACLPMSPYAVSKLAGENYAVAYARCYNLPVLPFRFFNVFGPLQAAGHAYAAVVPVFIAAAVQGRPLPVHGDGLQSRDFTYVETVAAVLVDAVLRKVTGGAVNLAFGSRIRLTDLVRILEDVMGRRLHLEHYPPRPGDVRHSQADNSRLLELFPNVTPVDLRSGIEQTLQWFLRQSPLGGSTPKPEGQPPCRP